MDSQMPTIKDALPSPTREIDFEDLQDFRAAGRVGPHQSRETCEQAIATLKTACRQLCQILESRDYHTHGLPTLDIIESRARQLDNVLGNQQALPNLGRLRNIFQKLKWFPELINDPDCKQKCLPWLWVPIWLTLEKLISKEEQVFVKNALIFNKVLDAYKQIGLELPRSEQICTGGSISQGNRNDEDGLSKKQQVLAIIYDDVLEFHGKVYKLLAQPGWEIFFLTWWQPIETHLQNLLRDFASYRSSLKLGVTAEWLTQMHERRRSWRISLTEAEEKMEVTQRENVEKWLGAFTGSLDQEDNCAKYAEKSQEDSCNWIFDNAKLKSWLSQGHEYHALWLMGNLGSGKSVLCANIIDKCPISDDSIVLYYFCTVGTDAKTMLRTLAYQILQRKSRLNSYAQQFCIKSLSQQALRALLPQLLHAFRSVRIVIDGPDDCADTIAGGIVQEVLALSKVANTKVLISSQDVASVRRLLSNKPRIDLSLERAPMRNAISNLIRQRLDDMRILQHVSFDQRQHLQDKLVEGADGMFLWAELVTWRLQQADNLAEIDRIVAELPDKLDAVYQKLFKRLENSRGKEHVSRVLQCLTYGLRDMKGYEIQDAITFDRENRTLNASNRVHEVVFDHCRPLIERSKDGVFRFVHSSMKQYLERHNPLFDAESGQAHFAYACLAYLQISSRLVDDTIEESQKLEEVAQGIHGFCHYACIHWSDHFLRYLTLTASTESLDERRLARREEILDAADNVALSFKNVAHTYFQRYRPPAQNTDSKLQCLNRSRPSFSFVASARQANRARQIRPQQRTLSSEGGPEEHPLIRVVKKYDALCGQLLETDLIDGVAPQAHKRFRQLYGQSGFACRIGRCPRSVHGFKTADERDQHEKAHMQHYRCSYPQCRSSPNGFETSDQLHQHLTQHHLERSASPAVFQNTQSQFMRTDTDATLVNPPISGKQDSEDVSTSESEDEYIPYGDMFVKHLVRNDAFARETMRS